MGVGRIGFDLSFIYMYRTQRRGSGEGEGIYSVVGREGLMTGRAGSWRENGLALRKAGRGGGWGTACCK